MVRKNENLHQTTLQTTGDANSSHRHRSQIRSTRPLAWYHQWSLDRGGVKRMWAIIGEQDSLARQQLDSDSAQTLTWLWRMGNWALSNWLYKMSHLGHTQTLKSFPNPQFKQRPVKYGRSWTKDGVLTCIMTLSLSSGAVQVLETAPAPPPATRCLHHIPVCFSCMVNSSGTIRFSPTSIICQGHNMEK